MSGSTFGSLFRVSTFGESHCAGVGAIVDGCPPCMDLTEADLQPQLTRRRPGQSKVNTPRDEKDQVKILSGTENGQTLGTPIGLFVPNEDQRPRDYGEMQQIPRPSHADFTYQSKYGTRADSGGGRSSARETIGRVAAGAIAEKWLRQTHGVDIVAWVSSCGEIDAREIDPESVTRAQVDETIIRCPDAGAAEKMIARVMELREAGDSIGGVLTCVIRNVPAGWGEPVFDKLEAKLAHAMMSIPATKGFEIGSGFQAARMTGSAHNDPFVMKGTRLGTLTNHSGGIQGGISNGEPILFRLAIKPPATISKAQPTADFQGNPAVLEAKGRHDPFVVNRAIPIVETMAALVLMDMALIQQSRSR